MKWLISIFLVTISNAALAKVVFLDVRTPQEYSEGHIPNAMNVDVLNTNFTNRISKLNKDDEYKVYCKLGARACKAVTMMKDLDFKHVQNLGSYEDAQIYYEKSHQGVQE